MVIFGARLVAGAIRGGRMPTCAMSMHMSWRVGRGALARAWGLWTLVLAAAAARPAATDYACLIGPHTRFEARRYLSVSSAAATSTAPFRSHLKPSTLALQSLRRCSEGCSSRRLRACE